MSIMDTITTATTTATTIRIIKEHTVVMVWVMIPLSATMVVITIIGENIGEIGIVTLNLDSTDQQVVLTRTMRLA